jgi:hypothetical protein
MVICLFLLMLVILGTVICCLLLMLFILKLGNMYFFVDVVYFKTG